MSKLNHTSIEYVSVEKIPLDLECMHDMLTGNGIRITSVDSFDKKNQKIYNGLQSEFFGTDFSSDWAFKERYSCKCGKYLGKGYLGLVCDRCQTRVEYHDIDLKKTGWIILDKFEVLSPIYSAKLSEALGKVDGEYVLHQIIKRKYDDNGHPDYSDKDLINLKKHPFIQKGMMWLRTHMDEVLDYYAKRKPTKSDIFNELKNEQSTMWTHSIPIYTSLLRTELPGEKGSKNYKLKINTYFKSIIKLANSINSVEDDEIDSYTLNSIDIKLAAIQREINATFEINYKDLTEKTGVITSKVLGGRYNFSARDIIVPDSGTLRSDEVIIGYIPFLELYRYELQNEYRKLTGCTPAQANTAWKKATNRFDQKFYNIIEHMTTDPEYKKYLGILINRNPSINYGSFIYVKIVAVKKDFTDKTLTVSTLDITPMNADFDGDQINVFRIIGEDFHKRFSKNLNPRYNLFISRMDGKVNKEVLPAKDSFVAFWAFNNM